MNAKRLNLPKSFLLIAAVANASLLFVSFKTFKATDVETRDFSGVEMTESKLRNVSLPVLALPKNPLTRLIICLLVDVLLVACLVWRHRLYEAPLQNGALLPIDGEPIKGELLMPIKSISTSVPLHKEPSGVQESNAGRPAAGSSRTALGTPPDHVAGGADCWTDC
jgi:hypothetical protein